MLIRKNFPFSHDVKPESSEIENVKREMLNWNLTIRIEAIFKIKICTVLITRWITDIYQVKNINKRIYKYSK